MEKEDIEENKHSVEAHNQSRTNHETVPPAPVILEKNMKICIQKAKV